MKNNLSIKIISENVISEIENHRYKFFPTMVRLTSGEIIALFRNAYLPDNDTPIEAGEHGLKGDIYITHSKDNSITWTIPNLFYDHRDTGENEQHSIVSKIYEVIYMTSRQ